MDVITMPSTSSLILQLKKDFPQFIFQEADSFRWSPEHQTIFIGQKAPYSESFALHELSHAILNHQDYRHDIDLIKLERDAWDYALNTLAANYDIEINDEIIQDNLDTYRDWLHARSKCPTCAATGLQVKRKEYKCIACGHYWKVNEARLCALRRYPLLKAK